MVFKWCVGVLTVLAMVFGHTNAADRLATGHSLAVGASIEVFVWNDNDGDGVIDDDEKVVADAAVRCDRSPIGTIEGVTGADGWVRFSDVLPGSYTVSVSFEEPSTPVTMSKEINVGLGVVTVEFGLRPLHILPPPTSSTTTLPPETSTTSSFVDTTSTAPPTSTSTTTPAATSTTAPAATSTSIAPPSTAPTDDLEQRLAQLRDQLGSGSLATDDPCVLHEVPGAETNPEQLVRFGIECTAEVGVEMPLILRFERITAPVTTTGSSIDVPTTVATRMHLRMRVIGEFDPQQVEVRMPDGSVEQRGQVVIDAVVAADEAKLLSIRLRPLVAGDLQGSILLEALESESLDAVTIDVGYGVVRLSVGSDASAVDGGGALTESTESDESSGVNRWGIAALLAALLAGIGLFIGSRRGVSRRSPAATNRGPAQGREVFVSYAREDTSAMLRLKGDLENKGYEVWVDIEDIPGSVRWRKAILEGLHRCSAVIVLVSDASLESDQVPREIELAASSKKPIFPVRLEDAWPDSEAELFWVLGRLQWIDMFPKWDEGVDRLLRDLAPRAPGTVSGPHLDVPPGARGSH